MRILHAYRTYFPDSQGGGEEAVRQICLNTAHWGVESRILSPSRRFTRRKVIEMPEGSVYRPRLSMEIASCSISLGAFGYFKRLVEWCDVVHYHFPWPFADVLHFFTRVTKPTVLTYHSDIVRQRVLGTLYQPLMERFLRSVDRIVCTSPNYLATSRTLQEFKDKVEVIPLGINEDAFVDPPAETVEAARATYGTDFFLFVGVLRHYKGLHILLDALKNAPYRVVIVGSGPKEAELKRQAQRLNLHNVVFTGYLPDEMKLSLLRLCRGVIFPSHLRAEAFGITLLEGAMHRRPLISTEVGSGTSYVNIDGETGLVVEPSSPAALRRAMDTLWRDPALAERLGQNARKRYETLFTGRLMGARYYDLYQRLTDPSALMHGGFAERSVS
jgi:rhamnosyl/mannosyltransferase